MTDTLSGWGLPVISKVTFSPDHTYVTSSVGVSWGCFGRNSGGKLLDSAFGSTSAAQCIATPNPTASPLLYPITHTSFCAGILYGINGVCHQAANRILFPSNASVSSAKGYFASYSLYGEFGLLEKEWRNRLSRCGLINANSLSLSDLIRALSGYKGYLVKCLSGATKSSISILKNIDETIAESIQALVVELRIDFIDTALDFLQYRIDKLSFVRNVNKLVVSYLGKVEEKIGLNVLNQLMLATEVTENYDNFVLLQSELMNGN